MTTKWRLTPPKLPQSLAAPFRHDDLTVVALCGSSDSRQGFEAELDGRGAALRFDLGGATQAEEGDPTRGIMDFKRYFARNEVEVGEEWVLEPSPRLGAIAAGIGWLRRIVSNVGVAR